MSPQQITDNREIIAAEKAHKAQTIQCLSQMENVLLDLQVSLNDIVSLILQTQHIEEGIWRACEIELKAIACSLDHLVYYVRCHKNDIHGDFGDFGYSQAYTESAYLFTRCLKKHLPPCYQEAFQRIPGNLNSVRDIFQDLPYLAKYTLTVIRRVQHIPRNSHILRVNEGFQDLYNEYDKFQELVLSRSAS